MRFSSQAGGNIVETAADAIVVGVFEDGDLSPAAARVDAALDGAVAAMRASKELKGKVGETVSILTFGRLPAARVLLAGLGKADTFSAETARRAAGSAGKALERAGLARAAFEVFGASRIAPADAARAMVEGMQLAAYRFNRYFSEERPAPRLEEAQLLGPEHADLRDAVRLGEILANGANFARDLANEPPNVLNPAELARRAQEMAAARGLTAEVFEPDELARRAMGALLAVGQGSENEPRLIVLHYRSDAGSGKPTLGLVGKGITFDTGGISIKPGADMHLMKTDMAGAAAMIGAMHAIAELKPALNVTAIVASAENMPDGKAFRPGDILRAMNGKTIEIQNTDAEGRLVLADALSYAVELGLAPIVDAATLTGACSVALGPFYSACFASDDRTRDQLLAAASRAGERLWPMPLDPDFRPLLDSSCADMRNIGGREGGAITAAMFLKEFVGSQPWAHLDIAPTAFADNESAYYAKGLATGHPARAMAQLALDLAEAR
ncbi:MAG TPA: leucyl aminopeptidase [Chloroflexota bacterium]|nr:leucyl aminopeptidase [Chloroflexota bacterium]